MIFKNFNADIVFDLLNDKKIDGYDRLETDERDPKNCSLFFWHAGRNWCVEFDHYINNEGKGMWHLKNSNASTKKVEAFEVKPVLAVQYVAV